MGADVVGRSVGDFDGDGAALEYRRVVYQLPGQAVAVLAEIFRGEQQDVGGWGGGRLPGRVVGGDGCGRGGGGDDGYDEPDYSTGLQGSWDNGDWDAYDRTMVEQRRTAVLVDPSRVYSNG